MPAGDIEQAVTNQLRAIFRSPEMIAETYRATAVAEHTEIERLEAEKGELCAEIAELRESKGGSENARALLDCECQLEEINTQLAALRRLNLSERDVADALGKLDPIWEELFPVEQRRIIQLLVEQVSVNPDGLNIKIRANGVHSLVTELKETTATHEERRAAV